MEKKSLFLINGEIISDKETGKNEFIKFEQLNINLAELTTTVITKPKLQETSTLKLINCLIDKNSSEICTNDAQNEIIPVLIRRVVLPLYLPAISLICSLLLIKTKKNIFKEISIFLLGFSLLIGIEIV